ncbi:MAG TPA: MaoC family dehydratase N-terminal domain-containing protein [Myxococcales bacterium]
MSQELALDHLRQWIGREQAIEDVVTPSLVDRFNATIGLAAEPARGGDVAPRLIHFCLCLDAVPITRLGFDGHPARGDFLPPVPLPRRMWASSKLQFEGDIRVDDAVRRESRVASVEFKQGRGGALCFVRVEHRILTNGRTAVTEQQTLVYRDAAGAGSQDAPEPAPRGEQVASIDPSPLLLFRYSALTFNAHRIHYDLPYATGEEGYPALVIHGPLQATLLLHFAARSHGGRAPDSFSFRGGAPAFCGAPLELHAGPRSGERLELWSAAPTGPIAMQARAEWK